MKNQSVRFERISTDIVRLTLCRVERSNAFSLELLQHFTDRLDDVRNDSDCRVLVLEAEGRNFCGGLDLGEAALGDENARKMPELVVGILAKLRQLPQIVISSVHGAARAGGGALVAASDLVVASEDFNIAFPEIKRGLEPVLLFPLLRRRLSGSALSELLLTAEAVDVHRARQLGLVHRIVPAGTENDAAERLAEEIRQSDAASLRTAKELILVQETVSAGCSLEDEFAQSLENHVRSWNSPAAREGVAAFLEKRRPNFN